MTLTFVETRWFTERLKTRLADRAYQEFQKGLLLEPDKGDVVPGCGGLRKARASDPGRGKGTRGGLRVVYLYIPEACRIDLIDIYGKNEKDDLSPKEKKVLAGLVEQLRREAIEAYRRQEPRR